MDKDIYNLIAKHLAGETKSEEDERLADWLLKSESNRHFFDEYSALWKQTKIKERISNQDAVFDKILNKIQVEDDHHSGFKKHNAPAYNKIALIAASIILFLSVSVSLILLKSNVSEEETVVQVEWVEKLNPAGQKSKIHLPDGSAAYLNAESTLRYIADFTDSARSVYLKGEAYFEVKKDTLRPFRVHSDEISITALGTSFNVNAFQNEPSSIISLIEGKVCIKAGENYEILNPGESLIHRREINSIEKIDVDFNELIAWKDGVLVFRGSRLDEVIKQLERWYGVQIEVKGKPDKDMKYNGEFANEYLSNVLESMKYGRDFDFTIDGKNVVLKF